MFSKSEIEQFRSEGWVAQEEFWTAREYVRPFARRLRAGQTAIPHG